MDGSKLGAVRSRVLDSPSRCDRVLSGAAEGGAGESWAVSSNDAAVAGVSGVGASAVAPSSASSSWIFRFFRGFLAFIDCVFRRSLLARSSPDFFEVMLGGAWVEKSMVT